MVFRSYLLEILGVATLWVMLFVLNDFLFTGVKINPFVTWIFLPAALRMVAVLLVDWRASVGLTLGALATGLLFQQDSFIGILPLALISGFGPLLAKNVAALWMGVSASLEGLKAHHLWGFALIGGGFNALLSQAYLQWEHPTPAPLEVMATMFLGDVLGSVIVLLIVSWILDWSHFLHSKLS